MKNILLAVCISAFFAGGAYAAASDTTVSLGWAHSSIKGDAHSNNAGTIGSGSVSGNGLNVKLRHEITDEFGLIGSVTHTSGSNAWSMSGNRLNLDGDYTSVTAGPSWRINEYASVYGLIGFGRADFDGEIEGYPAKGNVSKNGLVLGLGAQFNPAKNWAIDVGYEFGRIGSASFDDQFSVRNGKAHTFTIGAGYVFF